MENLVGRTIGKYKISELLGRGAMAEVYKAYHERLDRHVAIKILHGHLAEGQDFLARFEREARAVAALRHPHIVQIYDSDVENGMYYMVMEFVDSGNLQARMAGLAGKGQYMPIAQVVSLVRQVSEALDYAHRRGILHRDVKPSNVLLDQFGDAHLADFGLARIVSSSYFTATGTLLGTPTYMSPEQGQGLELTPTSDIYSLGVIVYELLTGRAPFTADTPLSVIYKHIHNVLPAPRRLRPILPVEVDAVISRALAKDPRERYPTALEMAQALERALPIEAIATVDEAGSTAGSSISALPTVLMQDKTQKMPVAAEPPVQEHAAEAQSPAVTPVLEERVQESPTEAHRPHMRRWSRFLLVALAILGLIALAVLLFVNRGPISESECSTFEACMIQADDLRSQGNLVGYVDSVAMALDRVPANEHPATAFLWCDRADALKELGRVDESRENYHLCIEWTEGDPDLQWLRERGDESLNSLR